MKHLKLSTLKGSFLVNKKGVEIILGVSQSVFQILFLWGHVYRKICTYLCTMPLSHYMHEHACMCVSSGIQLLFKLNLSSTNVNVNSSSADRLTCVKTSIQPETGLLGVCIFYFSCHSLNFSSTAFCTTPFSAAVLQHFWCFTGYVIGN